MNKREIPKNPQAPNLNKQAIELLTDLCFRRDDSIEINGAENIFVFGTCISVDEAIYCTLDAIDKAGAKSLILSGGIADYSDSYKVGQPESQYFYNLIKDKLPAGIEVKVEVVSKNCLENITYSLPYLSVIKDSSLIFITKSLAAGRSYLTLKKYLPKVKLLQRSFDAAYPENNKVISRNTWFNDRHSINRVYGEFLRIKVYGSRGDIVSDEVERIIRNIEDLLFKQNH